jgi:hypothetical protein
MVVDTKLGPRWFIGFLSLVRNSATNTDGRYNLQINDPTPSDVSAKARG